MVPVGSAMSQEVWLWFSSVAHKDTCPSRFLDLNISDAASRGAWGSLVFLFVARKRFVPTSLIPDAKLSSIDGSLISALP
jgi:hypothetical protein